MMHIQGFAAAKAALAYSAATAYAAPTTAAPPIPSRGSGYATAGSYSAPEPTHTAYSRYVLVFVCVLL
jgi:hypothetical protein